MILIEFLDIIILYQKRKNVNPLKVAALRPAKSLLFSFSKGKAAPAYLIDMCNHDECLWVDFHNQPVQAVQLAPGNDSHDLAGLLAGIAAFDSVERYAAVDLLLNGPADLLMLAADDAYLYPPLSKRGGLVCHDGICGDEHDAVKSNFQAGIGKLKAEDDKVQAVHGGRNRDAELFIKKQHWNIVAARGRAGADDDPDSQARQDAAQDYRQQEIRRQRALDDRLNLS